MVWVQAPAAAAARRRAVPGSARPRAGADSPAGAGADTRGSADRRSGALGTPPGLNPPPNARRSGSSRPKAPSPCSQATTPCGAYHPSATQRLIPNHPARICQTRRSIAKPGREYNLKPRLPCSRSGGHLAEAEDWSCGKQASLDCHVAEAEDWSCGKQATGRETNQPQPRPLSLPLNAGRQLAALPWVAAGASGVV